MSKPSETLLLASAAREKITPKIGGRLYGYRPDVLSQSVHDDLNVTAIALATGETKALLLSFEVCLLDTALAFALRQAVGKAVSLPWQHVLVAATHTHSGPCTAGDTGWGDIDKVYCDEILFPQAILAAKNAFSSLRPALLGIAEGESLVGINRRELTGQNKVVLGQNPWGCFDSTMTVLALQEQSGKPIANLIHYGAHCTGSGLNFEITRDWPGPMIDRLETETGAITAFFNGAAGDVGPRLTNGRTVASLAYALELGAVAARDAVSIYRKIKSFSDAPLRLLHGEINLPYQPVLPLSKAQEALEKIRQENAVNLTARTIAYYQAVCDAYETGLPDESHYSLPQTVISLGCAAFVPFPFEVFSEISLRLRQASPFPHTLSIGCANGDHSYLPSQDQLCRGGYEIDMFQTSGVQTLTDDADYQIFAENRRLLEELSCIA